MVAGAESIRLSQTREPAPGDAPALAIPLWGRLLKRTIDVVVAGVALVALFPLLLAIAVAVRLDSAGPAFFVQTRVGMNGRRFKFFKFRTMVKDNDDTHHRAYV